jgi:hypothetical protein
MAKFNAVAKLTHPRHVLNSPLGGVTAVQAGPLDADYLRKLAKELGVSAMLEDLLSGKLRPKQT